MIIIIIIIISEVNDVTLMTWKAEKKKKKQIHFKKQIIKVLNLEMPSSVSYSC